MVAAQTERGRPEAAAEGGTRAVIRLQDLLYKEELQGRPQNDL